MTPDEAFAALGEIGGTDTVPAMQCLLRRWDEAAPRCRALLHAYAHGHDLSEAASWALFPIVCLLGEKQDTAAFADLCTLGHDRERADLGLGDAGLDALPRLLISCFDGSTAPLRDVIERPGADNVLRGRVLLAMAYLAHTRRVPRTEMHAYLVHLFDSLPAETDTYVWTCWVLSAGLLGFGALRGRTATLFDRGLPDAQFMTIDDFHADLRHAAEQPESHAGFDEMDVGPSGDAVAAFEGPVAPNDPTPLAVPIKNPLRAVGRNDPCPCGSGKKYKKCCLV